MRSRGAVRRSQFGLATGLVKYGNFVPMLDGRIQNPVPQAA